MKLVTFAIICLAVVIPAFADGTSELLESSILRSNLRTKFEAVSISGGKPEHRIQYQSDPTKNYEVLADPTTFRARGTIELLYPDFNPLKHAISAKEEASDDPIAKQVTDFVDALAGNVTAIFPKAAIGSGDEAIKSCEEQNKGCLEAAGVASNPQKVKDECAAKLSACRCETLRSAIARTTVSPDQMLAIIDDKKLTGWVNRARGLAGVTIVHGEVKTELGNVRDALQKAVNRKALLEAAHTDENVTACNELKKEFIATPFRVTLRLADESIKIGEKLLKSLTALEEFLRPFTLPDNWRNNGLDYKYFSTSATPDKMKTITLSAQERTLKLTDGVVTLGAEKSAETKARLRYGRVIVPEVGVAAVYNELKYPKYKAETVDGKLKVAADGFHESNVEAATTLNLLWNAGLDFGYPGVQFGVSSAKDFPGFLGGFVFRFAKPKRVSLATGAMITWFKDLNKLSVGSEIAKESDIDKDLKRRRSSSELYFAVQYSF